MVFAPISFPIQKNGTAGAAPEENIIMREAAQDIPVAGPWTCPACGGANTGKFCEYCGSPRP